MPTISEALAIAVGHHEAGRLPAAEQIYRQILAVEPNQVDALHLLGVIAHQVGRDEVAVEYIGRAIGLNGNEAAFHSHLGDAFQAQEKLDEAIACYQRALKLKPDFAPAHKNLGILLGGQRRQRDEAVAASRLALALEPDDVEANETLRSALREQKKLDEVIAAWHPAPGLKPPDAKSQNNLGNAVVAQEALDEAFASWRQDLKPNPDHAAAHTSLGISLQDQGKLKEAVACYRRALELKPGDAVIYNNLGAALQRLGKSDEAIAACRRALELLPSFAVAHVNLGNAFKDQGLVDESVACYRRALEMTPGNAAVHSNLLLALQYQAGASLSGLAAAHAEYDRLHAAPLRAARRPHENVRDPDRRLRIGFVSPDFGRHPVGYFLIRGLEKLDRSQCETVCYSDRMVGDEVTARFRSAATTWRDVVGLNDDVLAEQVRADRIDILFDLAGHSARNRLLVFARKPSPVQITWLGYEGTTGLEAIDYVLADRHTIPPGNEAFYREQVLRMPDGYVCYIPTTNSPEPGPVHPAEKGCIHFGSFNNLAKITPRVVEVWAQILNRVPHSRLVLQYRGLGEKSTCERYWNLFAALGVEPSRLELAPQSKYSAYLAAYRQIDIALDPFPFGGGVTTCDALWMGVPVITCPGETFASRHGLSHLSNVGLTETVAANLDDYVELAASLAGDWPRLAALRVDLRQRMAASPLCDGQRFAENLMAVVRVAWRKWCHSGGH